MTDKIISAIISGAVAFVGFVVTYFITIRKSRQDFNLFEKEQSRKYGEKLYDLRLKHYGLAFELTDRMGKPMGLSEEELPKTYLEIVEKLRDWKKGEVNLVLSDRSIDCYYDLIDVVDYDEEKYSEGQKDVIWKARDNFRRSLRQDLGLLRAVDEKSF